jgi:membrane protease YdiL (CAAX protease family)
VGSDQRRGWRTITQVISLYVGNMKDVNRAPRYTVFLFVFLTYASSWTCWFCSRHVGNVGLYFQTFGQWRGVSATTVLVLLGNFMPGLVAIVVLRWLGAKGELSGLLNRLNPARSDLSWCAFAVVLPILILFVAALANLLTGGSSITFPPFSHWLWSIFINLPLAPLWEEIGWRGFLQSRLQMYRSSFLASVFVGLAWGPWHAPLQARAYDAIRGANPFLGFIAFCIFAIGLAVLLAFLYNKSRGNLISCVLFHAALNSVSPYFIDLAARRDGLKTTIWASVFMWLTVAFVCFLTGKDLALIRRAETDVA